VLLAHQPNPKIIKAIETLRQKNPKATEDELRALFVQLCRKNEAFAELVARNVFEAELDKLYDEQAREGKSIPNALRKPS
jgi:hypothetical protein